MDLWSPKVTPSPSSGVPFPAQGQEVEAAPFSRMDVFDLQWVEDPQISPDGSQVVYVRRCMDRMRDRRISRLWLIGADGSGHRKLTDRFGPNHTPRVSPDGRTVAFLGYEDRIQTYQLTRLWLMNPDGTGLREVLTGLDRSIGGIAWDEGGQGLYIRYDDRGNSISGTALGEPHGRELSLCCTRRERGGSNDAT